MKKTSRASQPIYNKPDIVVMAVYLLCGFLHYIHLEDVAIKAAQLSPKTFSWKKYPEHINLESVRISLKTELEATNKRISGSIRDGWMLTPFGLAWCLANVTIETTNNKLIQLQAEVARVKKSEAFIKTISNNIEKVLPSDIKALLRVNEYFSPRNITERKLALLNAATLDSELNSVLNQLKDRGLINLEVGK